MRSSRRSTKRNVSKSGHFLSGERKEGTEIGKWKGRALTNSTSSSSLNDKGSKVNESTLETKSSKDRRTSRPNHRKERYLTDKKRVNHQPRSRSPKVKVNGNVQAAIKKGKRDPWISQT